MGTNFRLLGQTPDLIGLAGLHRRLNIVDLNTYMMHATVGILVNERLNGTLVTKWVQKLDFGVAQLHEYCVDTMLWQRLFEFFVVLVSFFVK